MSVTRRGLLKGAAAAGVALGVGCGRAAQVVTLRRPGSLPYPGLRPGTDTIPQIRHIVVLMMENHSYDNHLGMLGRAGADGFAFGADGRPLAVNAYADGRLQTSSWEDQAGQKRYRTEVVVEELQFVGPKPAEAAA